MLKPNHVRWKLDIINFMKREMDYKNSVKGNLLLTAIILDILLAWGNISSYKKTRNELIKYDSVKIVREINRTESFWANECLPIYELFYGIGEDISFKKYLYEVKGDSLRKMIEEDL